MVHLSGQAWWQHVAGRGRRKAGGRDAGQETVAGVELVVVGGPATRNMLAGCTFACRLHSGFVLSKSGWVKRGWVHITYGWVKIRVTFCRSNVQENLRTFWAVRVFVAPIADERVGFVITFTSNTLRGERCLWVWEGLGASLRPPQLGHLE